MRAARPLLLLGLLAGAPAAAGGVVDAADFARGAAAVGERPTVAIALRAAAAPSLSFQLGAALRAWRNARTAIAYDASHSTGDGGDAEVLAEDCSDERIAFAALETGRATLALTPAQVAAAVALGDGGGGGAAAWQARLGTRPAQCHG